MQRVVALVSDTPTRLVVSNTKLSTESFELCTSERLCEDICEHLICADIHDVHSLRFHILSYEVVSYVEMFQSPVVCGIDGQKDSTLIVGDKWNGSGLTITDFPLE